MTVPQYREQVRNRMKFNSEKFLQQAGISAVNSSAQWDKGRERLEQSSRSPGSWEPSVWHGHITARRSLRWVRSDIIRTRGEINTPHCGWPQPQPPTSRNCREDLLGGAQCLRGHSDGCKPDTSEHELGIRRILGWKGMLWEQTSSSK